MNDGLRIAEWYMDTIGDLVKTRDRALGWWAKGSVGAQMAAAGLNIDGSRMTVAQ